MDSPASWQHAGAPGPGFWRVLVSLVCVIGSACLASAAPADALSLAGRWRFALDRVDVGITEQWFDRKLDGSIKLPGSLPGQGIGDPVTVDTKWIGGIVDKSWFTAPQYEPYRRPGNVKVPFWLQPEKCYAGAAWYQRDIEVPKAWVGRRVVLMLERPHWETRVWVDGTLMGVQNALGTPHEYDLGQLEPGRHRLTVRVDNRMVVDVGENSHSVSDHMQGNWNGIVGRIELSASSPLWIEQLSIFPRLDGPVRVQINVRNAPVFDPVSGTIQAAVREKRTGRQVGQARVEFNYPRGIRTDHRHEWVTHDTKEMVVTLDAPPNLWSEFSPELYEVTARLEANDGRYTDSASETFGFREIATQGTQFLINGRKTFFRGTLDCCTYPKTGHPPTDVAEWKRIIGVAKAHGLNLIRFHSWCPPEAAFAAADELGFYFHVEASSWPNQSTTLGDGKPVDQWLYEETDRILKYYGNHPSFILMPHGNEPGGKKHAAWLAKWVDHYKARDSRRLWTSGAGWPQIPENQWHCDPHPRVQAWGGGLKSRINALPPETRTDYRDYIQKWTVPVISHEIGQWCVYPNFDEITKYTGYLKPKNFEIFRDTLQAHRMGDQARWFLLASGKLQTLCYKEDIESALRTPGMGGFELLDLHDFPGQGTALVGVLDPFWEGKGYVTAQEYSRFCNRTVPLARLSKRVFTTDEKLEADVEVAHFGPTPIPEAVASWRLVDDSGKALLVGELPARMIPVDNGIVLGSVSISLKAVPAPARYKLVVSLRNSERGLQGASTSPGSRRGSGVNTALPERFENDWDVWVYPPQVSTQASDDVAVVEELSDDALAMLNGGGKVLLMIPPQRVKNAAPDKVALGFSSIFWNTAWTRRQAPTTLGILCDPRHPALADFPTDYHSNWQWWYLITHAGAMILDDLPRNLRPTVQVIDDWFTARKLGLVFEAKLGKGRLIVCSIDLRNGLEQNPVARQMLHSLLNYMGGREFKPVVQVTAGQVRGLFAEPTVFQKHGLRSIRASSAEPRYEAANAIDGDPKTIWHSAWTGRKPNYPHELVVEFKTPIKMKGCTVLPRQDQNRNGWIKDYAVYVSNEGRDGGPPVATGSFANDDKLKTIVFRQPQTGRFIRFVAVTSHAGVFAAVAELELLADAP